MKIKFISLLATALVISFTSCNDGHDDETGPLITLTEPTDEQDFAIGDTIFIQGDVSDNEELHEFMMVLYKEESGDTVINYMPTVHEMPNFHIDTFFVPNDTIHIHFHLNMEAWDHDNNKTELQYTLHWNE